MKKFAFLLLFTAAVTSAQMPAARKSKPDAEKIASALQAGPKFVTQNATVIDYPTSPGGEVPRSAGRRQRMDLSSGLCRSCPR